MAKFDSYPDNSVPADADLLISTDVSDTSADASGTTKKLTVSTLLNAGLDASVAALTATGATVGAGETFGELNVEGRFATNVRSYISEGVADERTVLLRLETGKFIVRRVNDAGTGTQDFITCYTDTGAMALAATSVTVPTPTGEDQAVKVVEWDATTGRYAVQGPNGTLEQGDTGWRDITADLENGWTATGTFRMRRIGGTVFMECSGGGTNGLKGDSATDSRAYILAAGWRFKDGTKYMQVMDVIANQYIRSYCDVWQIRMPATGATRYQFTWQWPTDDAWPTSLPGIAN